MARPAWQEEQEDATKLWMIPYADLMSNLVILFLALFAYSYSKLPSQYAQVLSKMGTHFAPKQPAPEKQPADVERIKKELERLKLSEFGVRVTSRYVRLCFPEPVLFSPGLARLHPRAVPALDGLAQLLEEVPNPVLVEGHTDDRPIGRSPYRNNWELSAARAFAVVEFFAGKGLAPSRFHARGYGEQRPAALNDAPEGRRANRRIEISLIREIKRAG
ncbi:MAG: OmpA family protein [Elusimicrobia bacterium]|nr:OmpA family protein [Elusimicrobiota bacterium]